MKLAYILWISHSVNSIRKSHISKKYNWAVLCYAIFNYPFSFFRNDLEIWNFKYFRKIIACSHFYMSVHNSKHFQMNLMGVQVSEIKLILYHSFHWGIIIFIDISDLWIKYLILFISMTLPINDLLFWINTPEILFKIHFPNHCNILVLQLNIC